MKIKISINGTEISAEISDDDAKKIGAVKGKKTGYERVIDDYYFYVNAIGYVPTVADENEDFDNNTYNIGNYYNSEELAWSNARADQLLAQMRQWQAINDKPLSREDWKNKKIAKFCFVYNYLEDGIRKKKEHTEKQPNTVYFTTFDKTLRALEIFEKELLWYFKEYQQRLDEE